MTEEDLGIALEDLTDAAGSHEELGLSDAVKTRVIKRRVALLRDPAIATMADAYDGDAKTRSGAMTEAGFAIKLSKLATKAIGKGAKGLGVETVARVLEEECERYGPQDGE